MKYLMIKDKWETYTYTVKNSRGVEWAALDVLTQRVEDGFWYYDKDAKTAKQIVESEDAPKALEFLLSRKDHEYEYIEVKDPMNERIEQKGTVTLYISHGAGSGIHTGDLEQVTTDWFIVEPRDDPERLARQVKSLRQTGRTVIELNIRPYTNLHMALDMRPMREGALMPSLTKRD